MSAWGKAGERLSVEESRKRISRARERSLRSKVSRERAMVAAKQFWREGRLQPWVITLGLDHRGLDGPEVDLACGVEEPTVDLWEAGKVYPTWEQVLALADLCTVPVQFFCEERDWIDPGSVFICPPPKEPMTEDDPVLRFEESAIAATLAEYGNGESS